MKLRLDVDTTRPTARSARHRTPPPWLLILIALAQLAVAGASWLHPMTGR